MRENFVRALGALFDGGSYVGIATHDEWLIEEGERLVREAGRSPAEYEFQMLLGVRPQRGTELVDEGHRLRIYVPYGEEWYAYSLRRLQENPKIAGYIASDTFGRLLPAATAADLGRRRARRGAGLRLPLPRARLGDGRRTGRPPAQPCRGRRRRCGGR